MYSSVRCVTVSPTTLSDSRTLVAPSLARRESLGKSSLEGRNVVRNYRADSHVALDINKKLNCNYIKKKFC